MSPEASKAVSVIMPFYNHDDFLYDAVSSLLCQTVDCYELIVVDDCSPRLAAEEILGSLVDNQCIRVIRNESRKGVSYCRNLAVQESVGQYILPFDADDLLHPAFLEKTLPRADTAPRSGGAYVQTEVFSDQLSYLWHSSRFVLPDYLVHGYPWTALMKREVFDSVGGYRTDLQTGEDFEFFVTALEQGWTFEEVEEPLYRYRKHSASATHAVRWLPSDLIRNHRDTFLSYQDTLIALHNKRCEKEANAFMYVYNRYRAFTRLYQENLRLMARSRPDLAPRGIDESTAESDAMRGNAKIEMNSHKDFEDSSTRTVELADDETEESMVLQLYLQNPGLDIWSNLPPVPLKE